MPITPKREMKMKLKIVSLLAIVLATAPLFAKLGVTRSDSADESSAVSESSSSSEKETSEGSSFSISDLEPGDELSFSVEDLPEEIQGREVLEEFLPSGITVEWTGKKFKVPKAGKVKYSKSEEGFVTTREDNPCGLKLKVNKKKGTVSGSFKVYVAKSEKKVKTYTAKVSGRLGETLTVKISKVSGSYEATLD